MIVAPQVVLSFTRSAGAPPIWTVLLLWVNDCGPSVVWPRGRLHVTGAPSTAAGCPSIRTVVTPGGEMVPVLTPGAWPIGSLTRAAAGMVTLLGNRGES